MAFLQDIWEGRDYVPEVWDEWLLREPGLLAVAERGGEIIGQGHLLDLGLGEWWLEGLRVRPDVQGQGVGSHLHDYFVDRWLASGGSVVRLATHLDRKAVHAMCERTGFQRKTEFVLALGEPLQDGEKPEFQSAADEPVEAAVDRLRQAESTQALSGFMNLGWRFARLQPDRLVGERAPSRWRWRGGAGLLLVMAGDTESGDEVEVAALDVAGADLPEMLKDLRRWAAQNQVEEVAWLAPAGEPYEKSAIEAGFAIEEEHRLYIYERVR